MVVASTDTEVYAATNARIPQNATNTRSKSITPNTVIRFVLPPPTLLPIIPAAAGKGT
jgi:hypothetical protein